MSFVTVSQGKDGQWWTSMLMTNQSNIDFAFEWLQSEDHVIQPDGQRGPAISGPVPATPIEIGSHSSETFVLKLPPPGTVRRFRIHYFPGHKPGSRIYRYLDRYFHLEQRRLRGHIAISPEVSADSGEHQPSH